MMVVDLLNLPSCHDLLLGFRCEEGVRSITLYFIDFNIYMNFLRKFQFLWPHSPVLNYNETVVSCLFLISLQFWLILACRLIKYSINNKSWWSWLGVPLPNICANYIFYLLKSFCIIIISHTLIRSGIYVINLLSLCFKDSNVLWNQERVYLLYSNSNVWI